MGRGTPCECGTLQCADGDGNSVQMGKRPTNREGGSVQMEMRTRHEWEWGGGGTGYGCGTEYCTAGNGDNGA